MGYIHTFIVYEIANTFANPRGANRHHIVQRIIKGISLCNASARQ